MSARLLLGALAVALVAAAPAAALVPVASLAGPVAGNPANRLAHRPIEPPRYDAATRCSRARRPGVEAFATWLDRSFGGVSWGSYRCERWGAGAASLHAEGRALDWHLDARRPADRREAERLILLLLAPDTAGNAHALARRMGVQEIIWDCGYWGAGMATFTRYRACFDRRGRRRRDVGATIAHRDHIHFGLTRAGARGLTSFWSVG